MNSALGNPISQLDNPKKSLMNTKTKLKVEYQESKKK